MAAQDRKRVVVVDGGYESYDIEHRILAPLDADVVIDPCHGDPARIKIASAEADAVLVRDSPIDREAIACMRCCRIIARYGIGVDNVDLAARAARGGLIDESALVEALGSKRIFGAGIDVFEREPPAPDHPLFGLDNVVLSDHTAWYSEETVAELQTKAAEEVARVLRGEPPKHWVNRWASG
jgi:phosphoglycerate dehydrogenase-like enzyme